MTNAGARLAVGSAYPEDDPATGTFWGPPDMQGRPRRWSRPWFEWRRGGLIAVAVN
jgi:hypothetical protein